MTRSRTSIRSRRVDDRIKEILRALDDGVDAKRANRRAERRASDATELRPYRLPRGVLDQELRILGQMSDVATDLAKHMRKRGVPEDDADLMRLDAQVKEFAKKAAWVLREKAKEAEEWSAYVERRKATVLGRIGARRLPKPDVREDPTTIH